MKGGMNMYNYTSNGINNMHTGEILSQLYSIDKKVKKINCKLKLLAFIGATFMCFKYKDVIREKVVETKGE